MGNKPGEQKRTRIQGLLACCLKRKARRRRSHVVHERRMSSHNPCSLYHAQCCHCTTPKLTESFAVDQAASLKLKHKRNETHRKKRNSKMALLLLPPPPSMLVSFRKFTSLRLACLLACWWAYSNGLKAVFASFLLCFFCVGYSPRAPVPKS